MLTCFLRTEVEETNKRIKNIIFNCLPLISIIYSYFLLFYILNKSRIRKNKHLLSPFMKYIVNVSVFYLLNSPMFILIIVTSFHIEIEKGKITGWFSYVIFFSLF